MCSRRKAMYYTRVDMVVPDGVEPCDGGVESAMRLCEGLEMTNGLFVEGMWQFGWGESEMHDFESKWNWLVLQAFYGGQEYIETIEQFLWEMTDGSMRVDWSFIEHADDSAMAYIDYRSVDAEKVFGTIERIGIATWLVDRTCMLREVGAKE